MQMQGFLGLKVGGGGGLNLQIWDLNRAHETERTVFPTLQVFSMCRRKLWHKRKHKGYSTNSAMNIFYNIANVNSERWLAKSRVDITLCQHGKFPATFLLKFFVLYYKRNIKHFFRIDLQLYQHSWKLEKLEIVWKHSALRASCFHTISRFSNFHSCWYNCISTRKMFYIS